MVEAFLLNSTHSRRCCSQIVKNMCFFSCTVPWWKVFSVNTSNVIWFHFQILPRIPSCLERLNLSGFREELRDRHVKLLCSRATALADLDLSDCSELTQHSITFICTDLKELVSLTLNRCYAIGIEVLLWVHINSCSNAPLVSNKINTYCNFEVWTNLIMHPRPPGRFIGIDG